MEHVEWERSGLAEVAAAIASAVYHATGVRVRRLPIKIEDLLVVHGYVIRFTNWANSASLQALVST
jgi:hypothetical protein